jgi:hypothetical protein
MTNYTLVFGGEVPLPPCTYFRGNLNSIALSVSRFLNQFAKQFKIDCHFRRILRPLVRTEQPGAFHFRLKSVKNESLFHRELRSFTIKLRRSQGNGRKNGIPALTRLYLECSDFNAVVY